MIYLRSIIDLLRHGADSKSAVPEETHHLGDLMYEKTDTPIDLDYTTNVKVVRVTPPRGIYREYPLEGWRTPVSSRKGYPLFNGGQSHKDYPPQGWTFSVIARNITRAEGMNEPVVEETVVWSR